MLAYAPKVIHFNPSDEHVDWNNFVGVELQTKRTAIGFAGPGPPSVSPCSTTPSASSRSTCNWGQIYNLTRLGPGTLYGKITGGLLSDTANRTRTRSPSITTAWRRCSSRPSATGSTGLRERSRCWERRAAHRGQLPLRPF